MQKRGVLTWTKDDFGCIRSLSFPARFSKFSPEFDLLCPKTWLTSGPVLLRLGDFFSFFLARFSRLTCLRFFRSGIPGGESEVGTLGGGLIGPCEVGRGGGSGGGWSAAAKASSSATVGKLTIETRFLAGRGGGRSGGRSSSSGFKSGLGGATGGIGDEEDEA